MISSHRNPLIKQIKRLKQKKYRIREKLGVIEGLRGVLTAVETRPDLIDTILYAPDLLKSETIYEKISRHPQAQAISRDVFQGISDRDNPTGLCAIIKSPVRPLADFPVNPNGIYTALHEISDPGNLGTILRSIDASGGAGLILVGKTTDMTHPAALKASMGTAFTVPIATADSLNDLFVWSDHYKLNTIATTANADRNFWQADYPLPALLLMGNEQRGLPPDALQATQQTVTIPMHGQATSLNLAIATSILLYEIVRHQNH